METSQTSCNKEVFIFPLVVVVAANQTWLSRAYDLLRCEWSCCPDPQDIYVWRFASCISKTKACDWYFQPFSFFLSALKATKSHLAVRRHSDRQFSFIFFFFHCKHLQFSLCVVPFIECQAFKHRQMWRWRQIKFSFYPKKNSHLVIHRFQTFSIESSCFCPLLESALWVVEVPGSRISDEMFTRSAQTHKLLRNADRTVFRTCTPCSNTNACFDGSGACLCSWIYVISD